MCIIMLNGNNSSRRLDWLEPFKLSSSQSVVDNSGVNPISNYRVEHPFGLVPFYNAKSIALELPSYFHKIVNRKLPPSDPDYFYWGGVKVLSRTMIWPRETLELYHKILENYQRAGRNRK